MDDDQQPRGRRGPAPGSGVSGGAIAGSGRKQVRFRLSPPDAEQWRSLAADLGCANAEDMMRRICAAYAAAAPETLERLRPLVETEAWDGKDVL